MDNKKLCENVVDIVKEAARRIENAEFETLSKDGFSNIVTTSDIETQHFLRSSLSALLPHCAFFCEEEDVQELGGEYVWIIDPIDGTTNYARKIAECAISVALLYFGEPIISVVYNIFNHDLFTAVAKQGAYLNGRPIAVSDRSFGECLFCSAMSLYKKDYAKMCSNVIYDVYTECNDLRRFGSCAIELCYLAAGMCDLYFEIRVFPWDYAGAYLILKEAGGILTALDGTPPSFTHPTALIGANTKENYDKLCKIISRHIKKLPYEEQL